MARTISCKKLLDQLTSKDWILLVNPPVHESRYSWVRWNQPLDLLKIGSHIRKSIGCKVSLVDLMLPDERGRVEKKSLPGDRRYRIVGSGDYLHRYPMWRFGKPHDALHHWLAGQRNRRGSKKPTQVWITSLCSYWFDSVAEMCRVARMAFPDAQLILLGQYPRLMTQHAKDWSAADYVLTRPQNLDNVAADLSLYEGTKPRFLALRLNPAIAEEEVRAAIENETFHFTFFEDNLLRDGGAPLREIYERTHKLHPRIRYHLVCGLNPREVTAEIAKWLVDKRFAELHFEELDDGRKFDPCSYDRLRRHLVEAGLETPSSRTSGFVWIGRPKEKLEQIIGKSFHVLQALDSLILKPFSPTPRSSVEEQYANDLTEKPHGDWSPHVFPFAELNRITRDDYVDLYRMAAFLNEKIRNRSFDFLDGTLGAELLRNSLRREVWNLEPSPLRIAN